MEAREPPQVACRSDLGCRGRASESAGRSDVLPVRELGPSRSLMSLPLSTIADPFGMTVAHLRCNGGWVDDVGAERATLSEDRVGGELER